MRLSLSVSLLSEIAVFYTLFSSFIFVHWGRVSSVSIRSTQNQEALGTSYNEQNMFQGTSSWHQ